MDGIRVSYILSTKDRAAHLERTLANVRQFITPADELIIADGGSHDATAEVVARFADIVTVFRSEPDSGEAHGFNKAALLARGRIIKPLTDDDYIYPDAMGRALARLEADESLDALVCGGEQVEQDDDGAVRMRYFFHLPAGEILNSQSVLKAGCGLGLVMRRRVIARTGLFDPRYLLTDIDYLARLFESGCTTRYCDIKLFRHVVASHSLSRRIVERDRDWIRVSLRAGQWPGALNAFSLEALGGALGVAPDSPSIGLVRALRDLGWMVQRVPGLAAVFIGLIRAARWWAQTIGRLAGKPKPAEESPSEPRWDGGLR